MVVCRIPSPVPSLGDSQRISWSAISGNMDVQGNECSQHRGRSQWQSCCWSRADVCPTYCTPWCWNPSNRWPTHPEPSCQTLCYQNVQLFWVIYLTWYQYVSLVKQFSYCVKFYKYFVIHHVCKLTLAVYAQNRTGHLLLKLFKMI